MLRESPVQLGECGSSPGRSAIARLLSQVPSAETLATTRRPALMRAIFEPSGDHTGPPPTRESIVKCGSVGPIQRWSPAPGVDGIDRIRLGPSRKRVE